MAKKAKNLLIQVLKVSFSFAIIYWLVSSGRLEFAALKSLLQPYYLIPLLTLEFFTFAFATERWRRFLHSQNIPLTFMETFKLNLIGNFFNYAMPGGVGGDLVKGYYITRKAPGAKLKAAITVFMDRLIGLFAMLVIALTMMAYRWDLVLEKTELQGILTILLAILAAFIVFWALVFSRRLHELNLLPRVLAKLPGGSRLTLLYESFVDYRHSKSVFISTFFLSLGSQLMSLCFFVVAGYGLGFSEVPLSVYFFVVPIGFMVQAIPISPAGVGVGQAAMLFLFNVALSTQSQVGSLTVTAFQIAGFLYGLIGAVFYLGISHKMKNPETTDAPSTT